MVKSNECVVIVIPARYGSSRFPGKPLADILGKPMIQHVYERASAVSNVSMVIVATEDERIVEAVQGFGGQCILTSAGHSSGTDRLSEVMELIEADIYINLQGDKPLVKPEEISQLINGMKANIDTQVGILCYRISEQEALNPNTVKVVLGNNGNALYFSRALVPYPQDAKAAQYWSHAGIYGYRRETLSTYFHLPQPMLERTEMLEQLRLLVAGIPIQAFEIESGSPGVDTPECLARVRAILLGSEYALSSSK